MKKLVFCICLVFSISLNLFADTGKSSLARTKTISPSDHIDTTRDWTIDVLEIRQESDTGKIVFDRSSGSTFKQLTGLFNFSPIELPPGNYYVKYGCRYQKNDLVSSKKVSLLEGERLEIKTKSQNFNCNVWHDTKDDKHATQLEVEQNKKETEKFTDFRHQNDVNYIAAQKRWESRTGNQYKIGDKICSQKGNFFGNVEQVVENRLKVYVIGSVYAMKVNGTVVNVYDGFFFTGINTPLEYNKIEGVRWFEKEEVSYCQFSG